MQPSISINAEGYVKLWIMVHQGLFSYTPLNQSMKIVSQAISRQGCDNDSKIVLNVVNNAFFIAGRLSY